MLESDGCVAGEDEEADINPPDRTFK